MSRSIRHIFYHILFWIALMTFFAISEWGYRDSLWNAIVFELLFLPSRLIAVYVNWFILMPLFLYKNLIVRYFLYIAVVLLILGIAQRYFVLYWGYPTFFPEWMTGEIQPLNLPRLFQAILIIISPVAFTTGIKLFSNWYKSEKESELLRQEKKEAELKFLKAQTNPHFLFNSLHSIYGLALENSEKTPDFILKLSNILSYTLYDSNDRFIAIEKEIDLIENIIDFEKERFGKRVNIQLEEEGDFKSKYIPPLILIPFVENAFKHGIKNEIEKGFVYLNFLVDSQKLTFIIENSIPNQNIESTPGGLGLTNITRRLNLLYGENKKFIIDKDKTKYKVTLTIPFIYES